MTRPSSSYQQFADRSHCRGSALWGLKRYEEALAAFNQAIKLDPKLADGL